MAKQTPHSLTDLIDIERLQRICDDYVEAGGLGLAVLDPDGTVLARSGWQDICVRYHRLNETTVAGCHESDLRINERVLAGVDAPEHIAYKCANGMWDVAFPLVVGGVHLATLFAGQFFYDDDVIDTESFRRRAREVGFDEQGYVSALARVPVVTHGRVEQTIRFLSDLIGLLGELGLAALRRIEDHEALEAGRERYRQLFEAESDAVFLIDGGTGRILEANTAASAMYGYARDELLALTNEDLSAEPEETRAATQDTPVIASEVVTIPHRVHKRRDGSTFPVEITGRFFEQDGRPVHIAAIRDITRRDETELALRESREVLRAVLDAIPARVFWKDSDLRYLGCNAPFARDAGFETPADLLGKDDYAMGWRDQADLYRSDDRVVIESGEPRLLVEEPQTTPSGRKIHVLTSKVPLKDAQGDVVGVLGTYQDISERRQAEDALRQNERLHETFLNATDDIAYLKDDELRYVLVNEASAAFFGRGADEIVGRTDDDLMPAEAADNCRRSDQEALASHAVVVSHEEVRGRIYEARKFAVRLEGGRVGVGGYVRDVTERTLTERALEKRVLALTRPLDDSEPIAFEDLFDLADIQALQDDFAAAAGVASIITRTDGSPITEPSGFCRLCRDVIRGTENGRVNCLDSDAALGRLHADGPIIRPCLSGGLWDAGAGIAVGGRHIANWLIGQVRDETQTDDHMIEYAREIGADEDAFLEAFGEAPKMPKEQFERVARALYSLASQLSTTAYQNVQQARFIAAQKAAEAEVARLNADLERRVTQRTAQLEATNRELESFAYSISHDLRSPLRALNGFSEILLQDYSETLDDPGRDYLRRIKNAANHMAGLMDGLLQLSRLNREELEFKEVDLTGLAERFVAELRERDPARDVAVDIAPGLVARADPKLVRAVIENLLGNAWKFTSRHETARIEVGADRSDGGTTFFVRDDGAGFDMRYAGNLFGAFQRLHTPDQFEGTGIGLATVQRIVHRHGGTVWAEGEVEKGATLWFTLEPPDAT